MKLEIDKNISNVEFVVKEFIRFKLIINSGQFKDISQQDSLYTLSTESGRYICGRLAALRLEALVDEIGKRGNLLEKVTHTNIRKPLERLIYQRFIKEMRTIDRQQVDRLFSTVIQVVRKKCIELTHFVPCHLMSTKDPDFIDLGPVKFHNKSSFSQLLIKHLKNDVLEKGDSNRHHRTLMADTIKYFRHFQWVAEVTIPSADVETSSKLAHEAVTSALDCLHLLLSAQFSDRMRVAGPAIKQDKRARLTLSSSGELSASTSWSTIKQVNFPDGWSAQLQEENTLHFLKLFSITLEAIVDPSLGRVLSRRFLDAAQWFGEASRDSSPSTKVVKFVTALERMVMTEEHDNISFTVSDRVAFFCADEFENFNFWKDRTIEIYKIRSRLVHGSISPRTSKIEKSLKTCAIIAERTLLNCLFELGESNLRAEKVSTRKLGDWFSSLVESAKNKIPIV